MPCSDHQTSCLFLQGTSGAQVGAGSAKQDHLDHLLAKVDGHSCSSSSPFSSDSQLLETPQPFLNPTKWPEACQCFKWPSSLTPCTSILWSMVSYQNICKLQIHKCPLVAGRAYSNVPCSWLGYPTIFWEGLKLKTWHHWPLSVSVVNFFQPAFQMGALWLMIMTTLIFSSSVCWIWSVLVSASGVPHSRLGQNPSNKSLTCTWWESLCSWVSAYGRKESQSLVFESVCMWL